MPSAQARKKMRKQMKSEFSLVKDTLRKNREKKAEMGRLKHKWCHCLDYGPDCGCKRAYILHVED